MGRELYIALQIRERATHRFIKNSCPFRSKAAYICAGLMNFYLLLRTKRKLHQHSRYKYINSIESRSLAVSYLKSEIYFFRYHFIYYFLLHVHYSKANNFHHKYHDTERVIQVDVIRRLESNWNTPSALSLDCFKRKRMYFFRRFVVVDTSIDRNANKRIAYAQIVSVIK